MSLALTAPASAAASLSWPDAANAHTAHEHIGFELGWDHARYASEPPAPYAHEPSPLHAGLLAGRAVFGSRALRASPAVTAWLQLRLHAWLRGRSIELFQVTPHYLRQLTVTHCPVTRAAFGASAATAFHRLRHDAGYAAGHLAMLSEPAALAAPAEGHAGAFAVARRLEAGARRASNHAAQQTQDGLTAAQWSRLAVLRSFVEPLPHAAAGALPLLVLPPNRLHLMNPVQALQASASRLLLRAGWSQRANRLAALLPTPAARRAFQTFFHALLPRVLEADHLRSDCHARWAVEDAWRCPRVQLRWQAFARLMTPATCTAVLLQAGASGLGPQRVEALTAAQATEGWNLAHRGYVPHARLMRRTPRRTPLTSGALDRRQQGLALV